LGGSDWKPKAFIPGKKSFRQRLSYPLRLPEEKSDAKFSAHRVISLPLYPYIPFFPQTTFPRRSGVLRKGFPQIFSPVQAYVGFWIFNRSRTAFAVSGSQAGFSRAYVCVRVCACVCVAFSWLDERAAGPFSVTPFLVTTGTNEIVRCYGCFF
jgi:hypothetical protein